MLKRKYENGCNLLHSKVIYFFTKWYLRKRGLQRPNILKTIKSILKKFLWPTKKLHCKKRCILSLTRPFRYQNNVTFGNAHWNIIRSALCSTFEKYRMGQFWFVQEYQALYCILCFDTSVNRCNFSNNQKETREKKLMDFYPTSSLRKDEWWLWNQSFWDHEGYIQWKAADSIS